jgi:hypothetical protein
MPAESNNEIGGGCMISESAPKYYCTKCEESFDMLGTFYEIYEEGNLIAFASELFESITVYSSRELNSESHSVAQNVYTTSFNALEEAKLKLTGKEEDWIKKTFQDEEEYFNYFHELFR